MGALLDDHPPFEDHDVVGQVQRVGVLMRHHDGGEVQLLEDLTEFPHNLSSGLDVEGREGLVQQEQPGTQGQRSGDGYSLLLTAGELSRPAVVVADQVGLCQCLGHPTSDLALGDSLHFQPEGDVVVHREMRKQGIVLEYVADRPILGGYFDSLGGVEVDVVVEYERTLLR